MSDCPTFESAADCLAALDLAGVNLARDLADRVGIGRPGWRSVVEDTRAFHQLAGSAAVALVMTTTRATRREAVEMVARANPWFSPSAWRRTTNRLRPPPPPVPPPSPAELELQARAANRLRQLWEDY